MSIDSIFLFSTAYPSLVIANVYCVPGIILRALHILATFCPHNNLLRLVVLLLLLLAHFTDGKNCGTDKVSNNPKITQLVSEEAWLQKLSV